MELKKTDANNNEQRTLLNLIKLAEIKWSEKSEIPV